MTVLLTNDDGYRSHGLAAAREVMLRAGLTVVTIAPDVGRSGCGRAATFFDPVSIRRVGGDAANPIYACDGTPVDCVRVAVLSALIPDPQVVVSGINEGANLGDDATYSGTLGAAIEGTLLGVASIAFSQQSRGGELALYDDAGYEWELAAIVTAELALRAMSDPPPAQLALNVNVPCGHSPAGRSQVTRFGRRIYPPSSLVPDRSEGGGDKYLTFGAKGDVPNVREESGTDFAALIAGRISLTPVRASATPSDSTHADFCSAWTARVADALDARVLREADAVADQTRPAMSQETQ